MISVGEKENNFFTTIRKRIINGGRIRKLGADFLAYSLPDTIVDYYFDVLESLGERIEAAEERLIKKPEPGILSVINGLKRDILSGMLDIYLSSISNQTNEIMKVLTIISIIFIPLTFLAIRVDSVLTNPCLTCHIKQLKKIYVQDIIETIANMILLQKAILR